MSSPASGKLVVVGTGLIGGSFALALKNAGKVGSVVGVGRGRDNLDRALRLAQKRSLSGPLEPRPAYS